VLKAVIDLGSRAARILVADVQRSSFEVHYSRGYLTLLGQGIDVLSLKRLNQALRHFANITQKMNISPENVLAFGTEVFRQNPGLKKQVTRYFPGFEIISGEEEAIYSFAAGTLSQKNLEENQRLLVIDQGGGSLELSLGYRFEDVLVVERAASFPRYGTFNFPVDYRSFSEELVLNFPTKEELEEQRPRGLQSIIGMGSVVTQLAFVLSARSEYRIEEVNGFVIHREDLTRRVRKQQSLRAFVDVLDHYGFDQMQVSGWGTRHGALFSDRILVRK